VETSSYKIIEDWTEHTFDNTPISIHKPDDEYRLLICSPRFDIEILYTERYDLATADTWEDPEKIKGWDCSLFIGIFTTEQMLEMIKETIDVKHDLKLPTEVEEFLTKVMKDMDYSYNEV
jgi:hypothetical protein